MLILDPNAPTAPKPEPTFDLEQAKKDALEIVSLEGVKNSYNRGDQEEAYWVYCDCIDLISSATCKEHIYLAKKIAARHKWAIKRSW